jgi:hypothetical protein
MFRELLSHPQEAPPKRHLVYCVRVMSVGCYQDWSGTRLNGAAQFLTVAYDDACSPNVSFRMACISFGVLPCWKKNLMTARVSMLLKSHASRHMLPFSLCNQKRLVIRHMNRPLFPTTLWILRHRK